MSLRRSLFTLIAFLAVATILTSMVYVTLQRGVSVATHTYSAFFTDASGLGAGDDVRMAGVRVGRVDSVALSGTLAKVTFRVQEDQTLYGNTKASISYQNIIGQRYLGLSLDDFGDPRPLADDAQIPVERTEPSFDISSLINGFEPLFSMLDPQQVENLTTAIINALQGDSGSITTLIAETSALAQSVGGDDRLLGDLIANLNAVTDNLARHSAELRTVIASTRDFVVGLDANRATLVPSMQSVADVGAQLNNVLAGVQPSLHDFLVRDPGAVKFVVDNKDRVAFTSFNLPLLLKGLARVSQDGSYLNAYVCDINITLLRSLSKVLPKVVSLATPGGARQNTAVCR